MHAQRMPNSRNRMRIWGPALVIICLIALSGCQASTTPATNVGTTTATLNAQASCGGGSPTPCSWYWRWGTNGSFQYSSPVADPMALNWSGAISYTVTGLSPGTTYSYQFCGEGDTISSYVCVGTNLGASAQFTTASAGMSAPPGYTNQQLIFDDQFSGTSLDTTKWTTYLGAGGAVWNNFGNLPAPYSGPNTPITTESAMFGPSQVSVNNGLTLTAQPNTNQYAGTYPWISGVVTTEGKFSLPTSGWYVQVKAKMPDQSQGMWPAIWFLPGVFGGPSNELDGDEGGVTGGGFPINQEGHSDFFANEGEQPGLWDAGVDVTAGYHV